MNRLRLLQSHMARQALVRMPAYCCRAAEICAVAVAVGPSTGQGAVDAQARAPCVHACLRSCNARARAPTTRAWVGTCMHMREQGRDREGELHVSGTQRGVFGFSAVVLEVPMPVNCHASVHRLLSRHGAGCRAGQAAARHAGVPVRCVEALDGFLQLHSMGATPDALDCILSQQLTAVLLQDVHHLRGIAASLSSVTHNNMTDASYLEQACHSAVLLCQK